MKKKTIIISSVVVLINVISVTAFFGNNNIDMTSSASKETISTETHTEDESTSVEEGSTEKQEPATEKVEEASTKKAEAPTKEPTTTKPKPTKPTTNPEVTEIETTTQKDTNSVTYDGHKPYEVFKTSSGKEVYYDEYGRRCCASALNNKPYEGVIDTSVCYHCGKKDCQQAMNSYYCIVCNKDIPALTCHPQNHYDASH